MGVDWREATLLEVAVRQRGTVSGPFGSTISKRFFVAEGVPVIRGNNLSLGTDGPRFHDDDFVFLTTEKAEELSSADCRPGDLVFTARGTLGQVGLIPRKSRFPKYILSANQLRLRPDSTIADSLYLYYWFSAPAMVAVMQGRNAGSALPNMNLGALRGLPVVLPPLPEQRRIAAILGALDDKIDLNRQMNRTLEEMAQAIFKSWFIDFDGHTDLVDSELGPIPRGWSVEPLVVQMSRAIGGQWGESNPTQDCVKSVLCIRGTDIPPMRNGEACQPPTRFLSVRAMESRTLEAGDLVFEVSGGSPTQSTGRCLLVTEGMIAKYREPLSCSNFCRLIRPRSFAAGVFLFFFLDHLYRRGDFFALENGTTGIKNLPFTSFSNEYPLLKPPDAMLLRLADAVGPMLARRDAAGAESATLAALRDTLLPKLISGEVRVPEAEKAVQEHLG